MTVLTPAPVNLMVDRFESDEDVIEALLCANWSAAVVKYWADVERYASTKLQSHHCIMLEAGFPVSLAVMLVAFALVLAAAGSLILTNTTLLR
eukprot:5457-Heterococcus_DN1.PRE.1